MKEKKNNGSSVFRIGAISLAFLILGYQTSLFVHRAAVLHIAAVKDHPDTVFVIREAEEPDADKPQTGTIVKQTKTIVKKEAPHSEAVRQVRERLPRKVESFRFNPNAADSEELQRLGFSEKQAAAIINYRAKGGRFHRKSDFAKSFVVADSVYRRLEPYIDIPKLDINTADSAAFDALPGIGPYYAAKMVEYRNELGRYESTEQLMDIRNFDREKYDALADLVTCGDDGSE